ncbi:MAG: hypothetical protein HYS27_07060 [Deltaproteobacteria bacterium]|nr:hypothetical protein [Deltaproteobacteria bacterium]
MRALFHALFAVLAASAMFVCIDVCVGVFGMVGRPFPGVSIVEEGLVNPVGFASWGGAAAGFQTWDRIVAVDGELVFSKDDIVERALARPAGAPVIYQVEGRDGAERFVELPLRLFVASDVVRSHTSLALLGLVFVVIATLLYFLRPGAPEAWAFFLLFASIGVTMASVVDLTLLWTLPRLFPILAPYLGTFGIILVGVIVRGYTKHDGARLLEGAPEAGEPGFSERQRLAPQRRMWALTALLLLVSTVLAVLLAGASPGSVRYDIVDGLLYTWLCVTCVLGLALLVLGYLRGQSPRRRARIRQILWAWPVGAGIPVINLFVGNVLDLQPMSMIWNGFLVLVPISTADAIVRHDLLRLNRTARRLVGGLTVAALVGMALGLVLWAAVQFLKLDDAPAMVALAALLFAVAAPATHRVQSHVEGLLRSRRYDAGRLVADFTARASTATQLADVLARLREALQQSIAPASFELYRFDRSEARLMPLVQGTPVPLDPAVQAWLDHVDPVVVDEDTPAPAALRGAALAVRLAVANEPVGLLVIRGRSDGTPYEDADVAFAAALGGPLAASLVNTLAFEAVEQLNRELEARVAARTAELEQKNTELGTLNQRKDELVATISHDFRSPLAVIRQNVQTVLRDLPRMDPVDVKSFLEGIARQEDRLTALCTNLLDLARLKQRNAPDTPVDLAEVARQMVDDLTARAAAAGVELKIDVTAGGTTMARGDRDRLGQVVQNLVDNALKFTPRGGIVQVRVGGDGKVVHVDVEDSGVGVPPDALPRLFEPFFQVPTNTHAGQGSGLGLAIVKAVVDAHGGCVTVKSEEQRGTTFSVELPALASSTALPASSPLVHDAAGPAAV